MNAGPTTFTRMPFAAYSSAAFWVRPRRPCFAATYAAEPANPTAPRMEAMFTIAPPPTSSMRGICARMQ